MTKIWAFVRHNSGMIIGAVLAIGVLVWAYGCQSQVKSIVDPFTLVTRAELEIEVEHFLDSAELRFRDLDKQDEFKQTVFAMAIEFMQGGKINPVAIVLTLGNILGVGAVMDNIRKRTHINTLKGGNGKVKKTSST